jgi:hypothetical protein
VSSGGGGAPVSARASRGGEVVRVEQGCCCPFIGQRGMGKGAEAVAWELAGGRPPLMVMGSVGWRGRAVSGRGKVRRRHVWAAAH